VERHLAIVWYCIQILMDRGVDRSFSRVVWPFMGGPWESLKFSYTFSIFKWDLNFFPCKFQSQEKIITHVNLHDMLLPMEVMRVSENLDLNFVNVWNFYLFWKFFFFYLWISVPIFTVRGSFAYKVKHLKRIFIWFANVCKFWARII